MLIRKCKLKKSYIVYAVLMLITVILNLIAWNSNDFCDAYIRHVFPIWVNTYGRLMNIFPFSVGEIMIYAGFGIAVLAVLVGIVYFGNAIWCRFHVQQDEMNSEDQDTESCLKVQYADAGNKIWKRLCRAYLKFFAWLVCVVCLIMTLNCTILYHASTFSEQYFGEEERRYTLEELTQVRNLVVEKCNELSKLVARDAQGRILYEQDIRKEAVAAMQQLGESYDQLDGYYPYPKPLASSDFFSQQYMCGYYFPFSMEANYNDVMYVMNKHATMCHELAHLRGYIFEDEANFISYLACIQSDNVVMKYSGYLSVLYYLDNDFYDAVGRDWERYTSQPEIEAQVHDDNIFLTEEEWERIEDKAVLDTEVVDEVSDTFTETVLKANGVDDGMISYSRVVKLLLQYYAAQGMF